MRVAIGQLDANGDCLYATTIARQIKADHPGCHLAWWISSRCSHLLVDNPFVDEVIEIPVPDWKPESREVGWSVLRAELLRVQGGGSPYDRIWTPQIFPGNFRWFDGTVRPSMFRGYGRPITVPVDPVIRLTAGERGRVEAFARRHRLADFRHVVLFECSSNSGQSQVTPQFATEVAARVTAARADTAVILSTMQAVGELPARVLTAGSLSMRENLALLDHCSCFVGCGSGLTVVATMDAAPPLPNIQILDSSRSVLASFRHDFVYWNKPTDRFVELADGSVAEAAACVVRCLADGVEAARAEFDRPVAVRFDFLFATVNAMLVQRGQFIDAAESLAHARRRYPEHREIPAFAASKVLPLCRHDVRAGLPAAREQMAFAAETLR